MEVFRNRLQHIDDDDLKASLREFVQDLRNRSEGDEEVVDRIDEILACLDWKGGY